MKPLFPLSHADLVLRAAHWLEKTVGCWPVLSELVTQAGETPDVIGWKGGFSYLVECKRTQSDFWCDKNRKSHRQRHELGMGNYRLFFCEPEVLRPDQMTGLFDNWGLLYCYPRQVKQVAGPTWDDYLPPFPEKNHHSEILMLTSALRRLRDNK